MPTYQGMEIVGIFEEELVIICYDKDVDKRYKIFKENANKDYDLIKEVDSPIEAFEYIAEN